MLLPLVFDGKSDFWNIDVDGLHAEESWSPLMDRGRPYRAYKVEQCDLRNPTTPNLRDRSLSTERLFGSDH